MFLYRCRWNWNWASEQVHGREHILYVLFLGPCHLSRFPPFEAKAVRERAKERARAKAKESVAWRGRETLVHLDHITLDDLQLFCLSGGQEGTIRSVPGVFIFPMLIPYSMWSQLDHWSYLYLEFPKYLIECSLLVIWAAERVDLAQTLRK